VNCNWLDKIFQSPRSDSYLGCVQGARYQRYYIILSLFYI